MPLAFWCVLMAAILPVVTVGVAKWGQGYDNRQPRQWSETLAGYRQRAHAAHQNGFEAFPFFAAAVFGATLLKAPSGTVDALALAFIITRVLYTICYVLDWPTQRSLVWMASWAATIAIFTAPAWAS
jgi:uncharacterized MAPEG superfamily protein